MEYPRLKLYEGFGERDIDEMPLKGWFSIDVVLEDGNEYTITFFDPIRLGQELAACVKSGQPCFAEENLIVVPEVTFEAVQRSIEYLWESGFFSTLKSEEAHNR